MDDNNGKNAPNEDLRSPEEDARFRAAVQIGIEQADRGEFIEEEEMDARIKRMLHS